MPRNRDTLLCLFLAGYYLCRNSGDEHRCGVFLQISRLTLSWMGVGEHGILIS